jgi:hypothetical protein
VASFFLRRVVPAESSQQCHSFSVPQVCLRRSCQLDVMEAAHHHSLPRRGLLDCHCFEENYTKMSIYTAATALPPGFNSRNQTHTSRQQADAHATIRRVVRLSWSRMQLEDRGERVAAVERMMAEQWQHAAKQLCDVLTRGAEGAGRRRNREGAAPDGVWNRALDCLAALQLNLKRRKKEDSERWDKKTRNHIERKAGCSSVRNRTGKSPVRQHLHAHAYQDYVARSQSVHPISLRIFVVLHRSVLHSRRRCIISRTA